MRVPEAEDFLSQVALFLEQLASSGSRRFIAFVGGSGGGQQIGGGILGSHGPPFAA